MFKVMVLTLIFFIVAFDGNAALMKCERERFEFKSVRHGPSFLEFKKVGDQEFAVAVLGLDVFGLAGICVEDSADVCLKLTSESETLFLVPKQVLLGNSQRIEWSADDLTFRLAYKSGEIHIIDAYKSKNKEKVFSFYYSNSVGLLTIVAYSVNKNERYIGGVYVSTCPGFLALE